MDNTDVFFRVMRAALGDNTLKQDIKNQSKYPGRVVPAEQNENGQYEE